MAGLSLSSAPAPCLSPTTRAMSPEVVTMYRAWCTLTPPPSYQEAQARAALEGAYAEASTDNWDGYGARAVTYGVKLRAEEFLDALPAGVPRPVIAADPDWEGAFERDLAPRHGLSPRVRCGHG